MMENRSKILEMAVDVLTLKKAVSRALDLVRLDKGAYACVSNVHMCIEVSNSKAFGEIVNSADMVIADGRPLFWAQRLLGFSSAQQVRGQDFMLALAKVSESEGLRIGLYGGVDDRLLLRVEESLALLVPGVNIVFRYSPPFRPLTIDENADIVEKINGSFVNLLFVGVGCPKQEIWMSEHRSDVKCLMVGVGAAFDFIAGEKKHAPRWLQYLGLEWAMRLWCEPRRLSRRYLSTNPQFIVLFLKQLLLDKYIKKGGASKD